MKKVELINILYSYLTAKNTATDNIKMAVVTAVMYQAGVTFNNFFALKVKAITTDQNNGVRLFSKDINQFPSAEAFFENFGLVDNLSIDTFAEVCEIAIDFTFVGQNLHTEAGPY